MHLKRKEGVEIWGNKISKQSISERLFHQNYGRILCPPSSRRRHPSAGLQRQELCKMLYAVLELTRFATLKCPFS